VTPKSSNVAASTIALPSHKRHTAPIIETLAVMLTAFAAGMTAIRRIVPRRGSSRLKLPPI
jgi:hypothetical protein